MKLAFLGVIFSCLIALLFILLAIFSPDFPTAISISYFQLGITCVCLTAFSIVSAKLYKLLSKILVHTIVDDPKGLMAFLFEDAFFIHRNYEIQYANEAFYNLLEYSIGEVNNLPGKALGILSEHTKDVVKNNVSKKKTGKTQGIAITKSGKFIHVIFNSVQVDDKGLRAVSMRDITDMAALASTATLNIREAIKRVTNGE